MADEVIKLSVAGRKWERWRKASVVLRTAADAGKFNSTLDDRWVPGSPNLPFTGSATAAVSIAGETVITGRIHDVEPEHDTKTYTVSVEVYDLARQMTECSAANEPGEWLDTTLAVIAKDLAAPFGVNVRVETDTGKLFKKFTLRPGETAMSALKRACLHRGVMLMSDGLGSLLLTEVGSAGRAATLEAGKNVHYAKGKFSETIRFSEYIFKGQDTGVGWGDVSDHASVEGRAVDPEVTLFRPKITVASTLGNLDDLTRAAETAAAIAYGKSKRITMKTKSWLQSPGGKLWRPNMISRVIDPYLRIDRDMLIERVNLTVDNKSVSTELTLVAPSAWRLQAIPETEEGFGW